MDMTDMSIIVVGRIFRWPRDHISFVQFIGWLSVRNIPIFWEKIRTAEETCIWQNCKENIANHEMQGIFPQKCFI